MITDETSGVWETWDVFAKANAQRVETLCWRPALFSWGYGSSGQLGQNNTTNVSSPVQIPGTSWSSISGGNHSLATKTDGTLWAWG
jgi:alpha-tubulin suppressor-like RCC1 family protein